jgi:hypothetical protein
MVPFTEPFRANFPSNVPSRLCTVEAVPLSRPTASRPTPIGTTALRFSVKLATVQAILERMNILCVRVNKPRWSLIKVRNVPTTKSTVTSFSNPCCLTSVLGSAALR